MSRLPHDQRPLFDPWLAWHELPDAVRQNVLDVLTALCLETVNSINSEPQPDDRSAD
jgi:hypothetical protein